MFRNIIAMVLVLASCVAYADVNCPNAVPCDANVYFSPNGGCTEAVVRELDAAKSTVLVQAYSFSSMPIARAVVDANGRGVNVRVILDASQLAVDYNAVRLLEDSNVALMFDNKHAIAHNKVMVIDSNTVITGSFNFTVEAERANAENLLVVRDPVLAKKYADNWFLHAGHSLAWK